LGIAALTDRHRSFDRFASQEPYFSILTDPKFLRDRLTPEAERQFFSSGEAIVAWMLGVIDAGLVPQFAPMSTLEYGCGIGRLALPLARRPGSVTAVDRSPSMLALARQEADRRGLGHIVFQTPAEVFTAKRTFDLVVCYHVLQRLVRHEALALMRQLFGLVGPGSVGVFQWPYRAGDQGLIGAARWLRERVPGVNAVVNRLRHKPADDPFIPTHTFELNEGLAVLDDAGGDLIHVALERHETLDYAVAFVRRPERQDRASRAHGKPYGVPASARKSDGRRRPDEDDIDAFNDAAEMYFTSLKDWTHHLAKPFSQIEETPTLLASVAVLLQALRLAPRMHVLEFGAGSGWLSRFLTQMGCRVTLLDVSPTALKMAQELYRRQPVIAEAGGELPEPAFLPFDGRRIDLPDASVDRIVCFDAFHHAANPHAVIREFGRVLADGGIAGFVEPGPRHADAPRSQFESNTYGVIERDVDVHDIWRTARVSGFGDLRMCVFHVPPYHVSLDEYEDLVCGGRAQDAWIASTRTFLRHVRSFYLVKGGPVTADSRSPHGLACAIRADVGRPASSGGPVVIEGTVTNTGAAAWLAAGQSPGGVSLGVHLYDASGALLSFDFHTQPLISPPRDIAPGEALSVRIALPPLRTGRYRVELDCVADRVTWFAQAGSRTVTLSVDVP
jgi:SAM-dependent methyltransferase